MKKNLVILVFLLMIVGASCSDGPEYPKEDSEKPELSDSITGYYYAGSVVMSESQYDGNYKPIYKIVSKLLMLPGLYGYNIMIPMPLVDAKVDIELSGEGISIDPTEAVVWSEGDVENIENLPVEGSREYNDCFSITTNSSKSLTVYYKGNLGIEMFEMPDLNIMVSPKVLDSFTDVKHKGVTWDTDVENFNLPEKVAIKLVPNTFCVNYRPYYQTHIREL